MIKIEGMSSINLVKGIFDEILAQAQMSLEIYADEPQNEGQVKQFSATFEQLAGVCNVINLPECATLCQELQELSALILSRHAEGCDEEMNILSQAFIMLVYYFEYVHLRQQSIAPLIVPTINDVRGILKKPLITESFLVDIDLSAERSQPPEALNLDDVEFKERTRCVRFQFEQGMLAFFNEEAPEQAIAQMREAIHYLDRITVGKPINKLWWVVLALLESLEKRLPATPSRKRLLSMIDREIKPLVYEGAEGVDREPRHAVMIECLYNVRLAGELEGLSHEVLAAYPLEIGGLTEVELEAERDAMNGPRGAVIHTVAMTLQEELANIKESIEISVQGEEIEGKGFWEIADELKRVAQTAVMLGLTEVNHSISDHLDTIRAWEDQDVAPNDEKFTEVADSLMQAENAISEVVAMGGDTVDSGDEGEDSGVNTHLEDARRALVGESRAGLSLAKRAISSYIESSWENMHLNNVPSTLNTVSGGLVFLELERAADALKQCASYIDERMVQEQSETPSESTLDTLADAITSIDYYLESMEDRKPIGDEVLGVAEVSMEQLGYPIQVA